jgi:hypothetical protein
MLFLKVDNNHKYNGQVISSYNKDPKDKEDKKSQEIVKNKPDGMGFVRKRGKRRERPKY